MTWSKLSTACFERWPRSTTSHPIDYLRKVGLGKEDANWLVGWVTKQRPLFEKWEVHTKIAALVKNLHDGCWVAYGDLSTVVLCPRVSGKAARVDPRFFNSIYQLATEVVKDRLRDYGIFMTLPAPSGELWDGLPVAGCESERSAHGQSGELFGTEEIMDVYFVDDGCYMIAHKRVLVATIPWLCESSVALK